MATVLFVVGTLAFTVFDLASITITIALAVLQGITTKPFIRKPGARS